MTFTAIPSSPFLATTDLNTDLFLTMSECTVAQAAEILDMSEGCVNELLRDKIIASRMLNGNRLVLRDSLLEFEARYRKRLAAVAEISREWQEMGLYDE